MRQRTSKAPNPNRTIRRRRRGDGSDFLHLVVARAVAVSAAVSRRYSTKRQPLHAPVAEHVISDRPLLRARTPATVRQHGSRHLGTFSWWMAEMAFAASHRITSSPSSAAYRVPRSAGHAVRRFASSRKSVHNQRCLLFTPSKGYTMNSSFTRFEPRSSVL